MKLHYFTFALFIYLFALNLKAEAISCKNLFEKTYKTTEFVITIGGKKESTQLLDVAHKNLLENTDAVELKTILLTISDSGTTTLTADQKKMINKFRQDSSFLRSVFQTSSKEHESPKKFAVFVRDFGHLKDMVNINESAKSQKAAGKLLKKFKDLDLENLLQDVKPASRKSVKKYFKAIIQDTRKIMAQQKMEVDELHDVRKNIRDILRYMQIQHEIKGNQHVTLGAEKRSDDTEQIDFLKKFNRKLGEMCDEYAGQIIKGEITDEKVVEFPEKLRERVEWFLARHSFE